jgi:sister chromatid cohesion protein PDS5
MQDQSFQVRMGFLTKLITYLRDRTLHPQYHIILFLTALDPEEEIVVRVGGPVCLQ